MPDLTLCGAAWRRAKPRSRLSLFHLRPRDAPHDPRAVRGLKECGALPHGHVGTVLAAPDPRRHHRFLGRGTAGASLPCPGQLARLRSAGPSRISASRLCPTASAASRDSYAVHAESQLLSTSAPSVSSRISQHHKQGSERSRTLTVSRDAICLATADESRCIGSAGARVTDAEPFDSRNQSVRRSDRGRTERGAAPQRSGATSVGH